MRKRARRRNRLSNKKADQSAGYQVSKTSVELIQYNSASYEKKEIASHTELKEHIVDDKINWFRVTGISDVMYVSEICENFGLHSFDIRDLLTEPLIVKCVLYEDVTFVLASGFHYNEEGELEDEQMAFILGNNFVISFKETNYPAFKDVEKTIEDNMFSIRKKEADFLLHILLNAVNTMNNDLILKSEDQLFTIEDQLILQKETVDVLHFLHSRRIVHMQLKRFMSSFREEYTNLLGNENGLVKKENLVYFDNLDDKLRTTANNLSNFQESLMSLLDLYYSNNTMKLSEVMKRLTVVSTIFIPLTFLVGVWGMNFEVMPELKWKYGYLMAWGILILTIVIMSLLLRKKKWF